MANKGYIKSIAVTGGYTAVVNGENVIDDMIVSSRGEAVRLAYARYASPEWGRGHDSKGYFIILDKQDEETKKAAAMLGRKGGASKSDAKQKASRENGKKGGRPKKTNVQKSGK